MDPGETPAQAAVRELAEEVGVTAVAVRPWIRYEHAFRLRRVRLFFFRIERWSGVPQGREGQRLAWVDPARPHVAPILPSAERVLLALGLPPFYALSEPAGDGGAERLLAKLPQALRAGLRMLQMNAPAMAPDQRVQLARRAAALAAPHGARVLFTGSALEARRAGIDAIHSTAADLQRLTSRPPVKLWVASCHDAQDLRSAERLGADAAVISPVLSSPQSQRPPLGWAALQSLAAGASIPLFAHGGVTADLLAQAQGAGAVGIATADWAAA